MQGILHGIVQTDQRSTRRFRKDVMGCHLFIFHAKYLLVVGLRGNAILCLPGKEAIMRTGKFSAILHLPLRVHVAKITTTSQTSLSAIISQFSFSYSKVSDKTVATFRTALSQYFYLPPPNQNRITGFAKYLAVPYCGHLHSKCYCDLPAMNGKLERNQKSVFRLII